MPKLGFKTFVISPPVATTLDLELGYWKLLRS
jgi:hypothetical protein